MGSKVCRETKAKRDKDNKKKNSSILTFFKRPKAAPVPSKAMPTTMISNHQPTRGASITSAPPHIHERPLSGQPVSKLITKFQYLINNLPESVPEGSVDDPLAIFEEYPKKFDDLSLNAEELWEAKLNGLLKSVLGWGVDQSMDGIIWRGQTGLDGLAKFVEYFIAKRGVSEALFEGKLSYLFRELEKL